MHKCTNQMDKFLQLYTHALTVIKWKEMKCVFSLFLRAISKHEFQKSKKHYHSQV